MLRFEIDWETNRCRLDVRSEANGHLSLTNFENTRWRINKILDHGLAYSHGTFKNLHDCFANSFPVVVKECQHDHVVYVNEWDLRKRTVFDSNVDKETVMELRNLLSILESIFCLVKTSVWLRHVWRDFSGFY